VSVSEKRSDELVEKQLRVGWNEYSGDEPEPWSQKRASSSGSESSPAASSVGEWPPANQELAPPNSPPSPQSGTTSVIQDAASSPEIKKQPTSDGPEDYPSSDENHPSDHGSKNYHASVEGGPSAGPGNSYPDSPSGTGILGAGSSNRGGSLGSIKNYMPWNRPKVITTRPPLPWNPHDWSTSSSESEPEPKDFMGKIKNFFGKLVHKIKFWCRGPGAL
jgi:hypothetical protein